MMIDLPMTPADDVDRHRYTLIEKLPPIGWRNPPGDSRELKFDGGEYHVVTTEIDGKLMLTTNLHVYEITAEGLVLVEAA